MTRIKLSLLGFSFILLFTGCMDQSYEEIKNQRTQIAADSKDGDPIVIGIAWRAADSDLFIAGVKLAVKEINQKGGVLNSPLHIIINDTEPAFNDAALSPRARQEVVLKIANSFAANPYLTAVIGHSSSSIAVPASVVYQNNGILFLAPSATNAKLTGHNFDYIFRTIPTTAETGTQLADFAAQQGYKNIAMLHGRGDYEMELADAFATFSIDKYTTNIVYRRSFFNNTIDIVSLVTDLKNLQKLDAVFIASNSRLSAKIYQQIRNMGVKLPIIGGETLDTKIFLDRLMQWETAKGIRKSTVPTVFNTSAPGSQQFVRQFKQEYGENVQPDYLAALGYDTVNLLAHGIQRAQSRIPVEVAVALRYMDACKGVAGKYEFKHNGDLKSKPLYFKHLVENDYAYEQVKSVAAVNEADMDTCNDIDRDHDTIPNNMDACPNTTHEEIGHGIILDGDKKGCPIDADKDGVADYKETCVDTAKGADINGCPHKDEMDGKL